MPMVAGILASHWEPDKTDEGLRIVNEQMLPILRQMQGFRGFTDLVDRASGSGYAIFLWETAADANAYTRDPRLDAVRQQFAALGMTADSWQILEVGAHT